MGWPRDSDQRSRCAEWRSRFVWHSKDRSNLSHPTSHAFYHDYRVFWITLKLLGLFPYHITKNGDLTFNWISREMMYSLTVYLCASVTVVRVLWLRFEQHLKYSSFDHDLWIIMLSFMMIPHLIVPSSHWNTMTRAAAVFRKWRNFQIAYEEIMNKPLSLRCNWSSHLYLFPGVIFLLSIATVKFIIQEAERSCEVLFAHIYVLTLTLLHLLILLGIGYRLIVVARQIRIHLMQAVKLEDSNMVRQVSSLWVKLSESCLCLGTLFYRMYGYIVIMIFCLSTMTIFALVKAFFQNSLWRRELLYPLAAWANGNLWLYFMCDCGHRMANVVNEKFVREIAVTKRLLQNAELRSELDSFIGIITAYPASLTLSGYVTINRQLFIALKGTMATYLIVLIQFSPDFNGTQNINDNDNANVTKC